MGLARYVVDAVLIEGRSAREFAATRDEEAGFQLTAA